VIVGHQCDCFGRHETCTLGGTTTFAAGQNDEAFSTHRLQPQMGPSQQVFLVKDLGRLCHLRKKALQSFRHYLLVSGSGFHAGK
jgi:hypothetical protein